MPAIARAAPVQPPQRRTRRRPARWIGSAGFLAAGDRCGLVERARHRSHADRAGQQHGPVPLGQRHGRAELRAVAAADRRGAEGGTGHRCRWSATPTTSRSTPCASRPTSSFRRRVPRRRARSIVPDARRSGRADRAKAGPTPTRSHPTPPRKGATRTAASKSSCIARATSDDPLMRSIPGLPLVPELRRRRAAGRCWSGSSGRSCPALEAWLPRAAIIAVAVPGLGRRRTAGSTRRRRDATTRWPTGVAATADPPAAASAEEAGGDAREADARRWRCCKQGARRARLSV